MPLTLSPLPTPSFSLAIARKWRRTGEARRTCSILLGGTSRQAQAWPDLQPRHSGDRCGPSAGWLPFIEIISDAGVDRSLTAAQRRAEDSRQTVRKIGAWTASSVLFCPNQ